MPEIVATHIDVYVFRRYPSQDVEFLLLKRRPGKWLGETWHSVHGKVEPGEKAWQAGLRELHEETGLRPLAFWQIEFVNTFYVAKLDRILLCPCFVAEVSTEAEVTLNHEHTQFRWEPTETALQMYHWPGQRRAVQEILDEIVIPSHAEPYLRLPLEEA